jgi:hypothetical protein
VLHLLIELNATLVFLERLQRSLRGNCALNFQRHMLKRDRSIRRRLGTIEEMASRARRWDSMLQTQYAQHPSGRA